MYKSFKSNELIEAVLFNKHRIKSYIKYRILLWKIRKTTPDYNTLNTIYDFIDQLNFAYFHCITNDDHLFINDSRADSRDKKSKKSNNRSLMYIDNSVKITIELKQNDMITLHIERTMGYPKTSFTFANGDSSQLENVIDEQLFINCTNLIMNELYRMIKKYRRFGRINKCNGIMRY